MYLVIARSFSSESFNIVHFLINVFVVTRRQKSTFLGWQDALAGKGAELHVWDQDGERGELTIASCPLIPLVKSDNVKENLRSAINYILATKIKDNVYYL